MASDNLAEGEKANRVERGRSLEVDGLRGVAILLVMSKHYYMAQAPFWAESFGFGIATTLYSAFSGVDLFFVLTGYLLGGRLLASLDSPKYYSTFYFRRVCRTLPLYYLVLVAFTSAVLARERVTGLVGWDGSWPFGTAWSMVAYVLFIQNFWTVISGHLGPPWLMATWSLAVQEQFYVLLPCLLRQVPRHAIGGVLAGLYFVGPLSRLVLACVFPTYELNVYDCLLVCRTDTLGVGVFVAWLLKDDSANRIRVLCRGKFAVAGMALFCGISVVIPFACGLGSAVQFVCGHMIMSVLYIMLVLVACFSTGGVIGAILRCRVLREFGEISYGLFLLHLIVPDLCLYGVIGRSFGLSHWGDWQMTVVIIVMTSALAEISWRMLEKPIVAWSRGGFTAERLCLRDTQCCDV